VPLVLWNVADAQRFVCAIVSRSGLALSWSDREELEQFLLVECWRLSLKYEPGGPKDFDGWAARILRVRVVDWQRQRNGRTKWVFANHAYERQRPELVSLDAERDSLGAALGTVGGDSAAVWDEACRGLFAERDRERVRDLDRLGLEAA
jgi:DNA-directed RNA polymerase specialized sigma24 family protein